MKTGKIYWHKPVPFAGDPIAITRSDELWTIRRHQDINGKIEYFSLDLRLPSNGQLRYSWKLPELKSAYESWPFLLKQPIDFVANANVRLKLLEGERDKAYENGIRFEVVYDRRTHTICGKSIGGTKALLRLR